MKYILTILLAFVICNQSQAQDCQNCDIGHRHYYDTIARVHIFVSFVGGKPPEATLTTQDSIFKIDFNWQILAHSGEFGKWCREHGDKYPWDVFQPGDTVISKGRYIWIKGFKLTKY